MPLSPAETDPLRSAPANLAHEPARGWLVVGGAFVCLAVIFGVVYSFAAFFASFASGFDARRADVSLVFGLCGLTYFSGGVFGGLLADRYGPRRVCGAGMACIAAGLMATSSAQSMAIVFLCYGVGVGIGVALVYTPAIACVQPWFSRRRGLAAGVASSGIGAGTLVVPLMMATAIGWLHWRDTMRLLAVSVVIVGGLGVLLLRAAPAASARGGMSVPGLSLREAMRTARFRWLYLGTFLGAPTMFVPFAHVSAAARDLGLSDARSVGLVGLIGIGSLVGRFAIGALADRMGRSFTLVLMQASMGLSLLLWLAAPGHTALALFALWFGLSYGGIVSLFPALCMDFFGARAVAAIIGMLYSGAALGNLLGPVLAGMAFDRLGSYNQVIWVCFALSALATYTALRVQRDGRHVLA